MRIGRFTAALAAATAIAFAPAALRAQEHDHDHETGEHAEAHHGHGGFPEFVDVFFTHHAYLERKIHPSFQFTTSSEGKEYEESAEVVWQFAHVLGAEVEVPFVQTAPDVGDGVSGIGDTEVSPMLALVQDPERRLIVTARSSFLLPTGDETKGLGVDGWGWSPGLSVWKGYGAEGRGALQAELRYDRTFLNEGDDEQSVAYNVAWSWWTRSNFIPVLEFNGATRVGVTEPGIPVAGALVPAHEGLEGGKDTLLGGTIGFRYAFANEQQWGAAIQLPLNGTDAYDARFIFGGIIHLE